MAHTEFTGASAETEVTYGAASVPTGWRKVTIAEKGKSLAPQLDITHAGDASYAFIDDPLGAQGAPSSTVTIEGLLSSTDFTDSGITSLVIDAAAELIVTTTVGGDEFTLADAVYKSFDAGAGFAAVQPYSLTFTNAGSAGTWGTDA